MKNIKLALVGLALSGSIGVAQACTMPPAPPTLDGATATYEQMVAGQTAVKSFQAANMEYMNCLDPLLSDAMEAAKADSATDEDKAALKALEEQYNAAVSMEEEVAGQFNTQIRAFKAANPS